MYRRILILSLCLSFAPAAGAEMVYKYRRADGQVTYSNRPLAGLELIETFDYRVAAPGPGGAATREASKTDAEGEARIRKYLDLLQAAWSEVQAAGKALATAEDRLRAAEEPRGGERAAVAAAPAPFAPPPPPADVGGPISLPPSVGGVPAPAASAAGGPMSGRRGRATPDYVARVESAEAEVRGARARLEEALRRYNQLR